MKFNQASIRILVRGDYGKCFDFYTEKMGLVAVWGDRNGPYTSFSVSEKEPPCFAIFAGAHMSMFNGYEQPKRDSQPDTIVAVIPSEDFENDYKRLKDAGVSFIGEPQFIEAWSMKCAYFRDTEGNLFELNDNSGI